MIKRLLKEFRFLLHVSLFRSVVYLFFTYSGYMFLYQEQIPYDKFTNIDFLVGVWLSGVVFSIPIEAFFNFYYYEDCNKTPPKNFIKIDLAQLDQDGSYEGPIKLNNSSYRLNLEKLPQSDSVKCSESES